jgi:hypothetical protein
MPDDFYGSLEQISHPARLDLGREELRCMDILLDELTGCFLSVENPQFLASAGAYAGELPRALRLAMEEFRLREQPPGMLIVSGYHVDDHRIGPTPLDLTRAAANRRTSREDMLFVVVASLLGDVFGWRREQGGRLVHEIFPLRAHQDVQISTGSQQEICWHTEDAFHPNRADYVGLLCMRNPARTPSTFATLAQVRLNPRQIAKLSEPRFVFHPDLSHCDGRGPVRLPILSGPPDAPFLAIDPYFMDLDTGDAEANEALQALIGSLSAALTEFVLEPGDLCFLDNLRCVHGRKAFRASYDGRDRWLKRLNITRDLRKSRARRTSPDDRLID